MSGFFPDGSFQKEKAFSTASRCGACGLYKRCKSPKIKPLGVGEQKILIVLPPVTDSEDRSGKFLQSRLGGMIKTLLRENGVNPLEDCVFTSSLICYTDEPTNTQIDFCSFKLKEVIEAEQPTLILAIGDEATRSVIQFTWKRSAGKTERWFGQQIPAQEINAWVCPIYAPTFEERYDRHLPFFEQQFIDALRLRGEPPWSELPEYEKRIQIVTSEKKITKILSEYFEAPFAAAFDYETNTLKPDNTARSRIVSGSLCFSPRLVYAFPWFPNMPGIIKRMASNPQGHWIGSNNKYEQRWSLAVGGFRIRRWLWDTMLAAHAIDSRGGRDDDGDSASGGGLSSIKFQAFALLGQPVYDDHIKAYLDTDGQSYKKNKIHELPLESVLQYNGMDALMTWLVAKKQMKRMKAPELEFMK